MENFDVVFSVDGRQYGLRLSRFPQGWAIGCGHVDGKDGVLGEVAGDAWLSDPKGFIRHLENKNGWDHDGLHSYAYPHEDPEEGRATVQLQAFERTEQVAEDFFERFMAEFGLACLDAAKHFGDPDSWGVLRPRLEALRARAASGVAGLLRAAEAFAAEGRWNEALFVARKIIERSPASPRAWSVQGRALAGLDKTESAERSLDEALRLAPEDGPALSARATLRLRRKDETGALQDLEALLKVLPAGPERDALLKETEGLRGRRL